MLFHTTEIIILLQTWIDEEEVQGLGHSLVKLISDSLD
jgi:hypothetical protein